MNDAFQDLALKLNEVEINSKEQEILEKEFRQLVRKNPVQARDFFDSIINENSSIAVEDLYFALYDDSCECDFFILDEFKRLFELVQKHPKNKTILTAFDALTTPEFSKNSRLIPEITPYISDGLKTENDRLRRFFTWISATLLISKESELFNQLMDIYQNDKSRAVRYVAKGVLEDFKLEFDSSIVIPELSFWDKFLKKKRAEIRYM